MYSLKTTDGITVHTGSLIWYVNYLAQVRPTLFKMRGKGSVKYFYWRKNAVEFREMLQPLDVYERQKLLNS